MSSNIAKDRLARKVDRILRGHEEGSPDADRALYEGLDMQEVLTAALLPINSTLRTRIVGALRRDKKHQDGVRALKEAAKEDELVPVEVHGGGKCKITVFMTREAADRERGR